MSRPCLRAEEHFRSRALRPAIIEKDYYVTEALRIIATAAGDKVIFKGGTSLSKGWNLIQRFSEDIDIFLDPVAFKPALGKRGIDRELKKLRDAIGEHPALTFTEAESQTIGGLGRSDRFSYTQRFGGPGAVVNRVLVEAGTASGREPTAMVELRSFLGQFLSESGVSLGTEDEGGVYAPAVALPANLRRENVRHPCARWNCSSGIGGPSAAMPATITTCSSLPPQQEVRDMLQSPEYAAIKTDYDQISRANFPRAISIPRHELCEERCTLSARITCLDLRWGPHTRISAKILCYGPFPSWAEGLLDWRRFVRFCRA